MANITKPNKSDQPRLEDLITLQVASTICGLTQPHLALLIRQGKLWGEKIGRDWFTTREAIDHYMSVDHKPGPKTKNH
jgi:hypothetical protein